MWFISLQWYLLHRVLHRTIIQNVAQIAWKPTPQLHGVIGLINIERAYANSVVNNDIMDRIIDIFGRGNGRESYFF